VAIGFGLGPTEPTIRPPFANLHGGYPAGLPSYGSNPGGAVSSGSFESFEQTADPPDQVLDTYERAIDRAIWSVASRGRSNIALVLRADPGIRGGVVVIPIERGSHITLFVEDMQLPSGFPLDFPIGHRARAMDQPGEVSSGVFHLRWDVGGNAGGGRFIEQFATALEDAGWQVLTKQADVASPHSLTCRSRAKPEISCRAVVSVVFGRLPTDRSIMEIADVWVGPGAESAR
jgi:hypothetical protein